MTALHRWRARSQARPGMPCAPSCARARGRLRATGVASRARALSLFLMMTMTMTMMMVLVAVALTAAAAPLSIPTVPPARQGCSGPWQSVAGVSGTDGGIGYLLEAAYDPATGSGRLQRRNLDPRGGNGLPLLSGPLWEAAGVLDGTAAPARPPPAQRRIFTMSANGAAIAFDWAALDEAQRAALAPGADGLGQARLDYVRGERAREGAPFRRRASLLGDIVRSAPLLVGAPASSTLDAGGAGHAAFYQRYRAREKLVYVGANDGMLHAFDWNDGVERFAYIPAALVPSLYQLTDVDGGRRPGVDAAPAHGEAVIDGRWRSVLAAGVGMSARGLFALDITDPSVAPGVLWEFTERDDDAIGFITAPPQIVKLRVAARGVSTYRYFVAVGNGWNGADGATDGTLFLLALDKPATARWRQGDNYFRLRAAAHAPRASNALAPPVFTFGPDGSVHSAYAGDLQGTLWRFDLDALAGSGGMAADGAGAGHALFHARAADGAAQPITEGARVVFAPGGGYLVLFGTGRAIETGDLDASSFVQQSFYAVRDTDTRPPMPLAGRNVLAARTLREVDGGAGFSVRGAAIDYNAAGSDRKQGWYVDFLRSLAEGERLAALPLLADGAVVIRTAAPAGDHCAPVLRNYVFDTLSGLPFDGRGLATGERKAASGMDVAAAVTGRRSQNADGNVPLVLAGVAGVSAATPAGTNRVLHSISVLGVAPGGLSLLDRVAVSRPAGRLSWREIVNWRELHDAAIHPR